MAKPLMKAWQRVVFLAMLFGLIIFFGLMYLYPLVEKGYFGAPAALVGLLLAMAWTWWSERRKH